MLSPVPAPEFSACKLPAPIFFVAAAFMTNSPPESIAGTVSTPPAAGIKPPVARRGIVLIPGRSDPIGPSTPLIPLLDPKPLKKSPAFENRPEKKPCLLEGFAAEGRPVPEPAPPTSK